MQFPKRLSKALVELREAFDYSVDTNSSTWDFAVSMLRLTDLGLNESDLRWLAKKGYLEHRVEVTLRGTDGREFRSIGDLTFSKRTCFVLTQLGASSFCSESFDLEVADPTQTKRVDAAHSHVSPKASKPEWDADLRKLTLDGMLIKRFKWAAPNQEAILNAFQEEGWPEKIDDPLPPEIAEQDPKRRLADTIKCLNRKQTNCLLHFHGDGSGEGILWERCLHNSNGAGIHHSNS